jgi:hypothetical protein
MTAPGATRSNPSVYEISEQWNVVCFECRDRLQVAQLQLRHPAAALLRNGRDRNPVVLKHRNEVLIDLRFMFVAIAGGVQGNLSGRALGRHGRDSRLLALCFPILKGFCMEFRETRVPMNPKRHSITLRTVPLRLAALMTSATTGIPASLPTVAAEEKLIAHRCAFLLEAKRLGSQHQVR